MIDSDGYIKLTDFGLAKENITNSNKANSFCGTPEYLAPEILEKVPYGKEVDWWGLGVIVYEMLTGMPPFFNQNKIKLFDSISNLKVNYPHFLSPEASKFLRELLVKENRLGHDSIDRIKSHEFFYGIKWEAIYEKKIRPPFVPNLRWDADTKYIDAEFLLEMVSDSYQKGDTIESKDDMFEGFSFNNKISNSSNGIIVDCKLYEKKDFKSDCEY